jgi:hypothetical protein
MSQSTEGSPELSKLQIAEHQLDRAIQLLLDENDYVCAVTLAGASEEILGKLLELRGHKPALASFAEACVQMGRHIYKESWSKKEFVTMENYFRDGLKHITDGQPLAVPKAAAVEIIDRAIDNYWNLTGRESKNIRRFMEAAHGAA